MHVKHDVNVLSWFENYGNDRRFFKTFDQLIVRHTYRGRNFEIDQVLIVVQVHEGIEISYKIRYNTHFKEYSRA